MANLPDKVDCVVAADGSPVMGLMLQAEFKTSRKNAYTLVFGPTNRDGHALLDHAAITQQADSQLNLALMDFDPLDKAFSGVVRITVMQEADVQNALRAYELFKGVANFADHYQDDLKSALTILRQTGTRRLSVHATVEPPSVTVLVE
jgi:hypothetical protein